MQNFAGKVAVVTGGASGIGLLRIEIVLEVMPVKLHIAYQKSVPMGFLQRGKK